MFGASKNVSLNDMDAETVGKLFSSKCDGKCAVITGCSVGGLGFETARVLAKFGAAVVLCCRTQEACDLAVQTLRETQHNLNTIHSFPLNLSSLLSIQRCAEQILSLHKPIHILINNAGTKEIETKLTEDGFESQWQTNFLGQFYFTNLLFPALVQAGAMRDQPARVINVSSIMQYIYCTEQGLAFEEFKYFHANDENENSAALFRSKDALRWYSESKLAMVLFAKEICNRMAPHVIGVSVNPGLIPSTHLYRSLGVTGFVGYALRIASTGKGKLILKEKHKSIEQGAATSVYCALHVSIRPGEYYADCGINNLVHVQATDEYAGNKLWEAAQQQIDFRLERIEEVQQRLQQITRNISVCK